MKKASKILLSTLLLSGMLFTMRVNAQESTPTEPQSESTGMGALLFEDITKEKFDSIVPNTIEINETRTDFVNTIIENENSLDGDVLTKAVEKINGEVQEKIITLFENSGYMDTLEEEKKAIIVEINDPYFDYDVMTVSLNADGTTKYSKEITIKFSKEDNYSTTDETYVKNKVNSIKFAKYGDMDAVFTIYNLGDEENANKWTEKTYDFTKLLNDNSITIKTSIAAGGFGGGTPWGMIMLLHFYKNSVLYESKPIYNLGAFGTTLENGTPVNMAKLEKEDETYKELEKELSNRGLSNIIDCYELTAYGETTDNMKVSFTLGNDYNGKDVQILHRKKDNTYEIFKTTVKDGKAEITVSEFSPFMIALSDGTTVQNTDASPNNAQTSSMDIVLYSILALGSIVGITYILVSKKKKEIA